MKQRETNYDLLRTISAIAIIWLHVSVRWVTHCSEVVAAGGDIHNIALIACIYNALSRFAVPCFVMLSGAFVLDDKRTASYSEFYKNRWETIGIHALIFSVLYLLFQLLLC